MSDPIRFQVDGKVRIADSGKNGPHGVVITNESGVPVRGVAGIRYEANPNSIPTLTITLETWSLAVELDRAGVTFEASVDDLRAHLKEIAEKRVAAVSAES